MKRRAFLGSLAVSAAALGSTRAPAFRLGMAGLVHGHAAGFLGRNKGRTDFELVGIAEPDREVVSRYVRQFHLDPAQIHDSLDAMIDRCRPEAILAYTSTAEHARVVETCARRGLSVMMEKPLAVSVEHALAMKRAAEAARVHVLVNYETTWYSSMREAYRLAKPEGALGPIRKVVMHAGHKGPKEIGVQPEFLAWLTDPAQGGGGALFDFGCYGANLMTWLMDQGRPTSVTAVTRQFKPEIYPKADDEATIILDYPEAQAILQASWNWPFDRKDIEIYGRTGSVLTAGLDGLRVHLAGKQEEIRTAPPIAPPEDDSLRYFAAVVRGEIAPAGLSSFENNLIVTEILDAARRSAATGQSVRLS
jgi:predicted dehydrogenase